MLQLEKPDIFGRITPKQEQFIDDYLDSDFIIQAANSTGISERTARRWLAEPAIRAAIEHVREMRRTRREDRLAVCMDKAINILYDNLLCAEDDAEAARTHNHITDDLEFKYVALMLKYAHDSREVDALKQRITQLEMEAREQAAASDVPPFSSRDNLLRFLTDDQFELFQLWIKEGREREPAQVVDGTVTLLRKAQ